MNWRALLLWFVSTLCLLVTLLLLVGVNMRRGMNHDEYQFVASGQLMATAGLLPYRDFPYFHVPGLSLLYAGLFQVTPRLLLAARLFSVLCGWLMVVVLWVMTLTALSRARLWVRLAGAGGVLLLLLGAPLFIYTSGRAWNHDLPMLLTVLAVWIFDRAWRWGGDAPGVETAGLTAKTGLSRLRGDGAGLPLALVGCGLLLGLATATRLSFAFAVLAFVLALLFTPNHRWYQRRYALCYLLAGTVVGLAPALPFFYGSPQAFLFGNLTYIELNTAYYYSLATPPPTMTLFGKLTFLGDLLYRQPANSLPFLALSLLIVCAWSTTRRAAIWARLRLWICLFLCMLLSGLVATPAQPQYFYPLWPLALLAVPPLLKLANRWHWALIALLLVAGAIAAFLSCSPYQAGLEIVFSPREWYPNKLHARGQWVRTLVNAGDQQPNAVLTVAPIIPLEGGVAIYPELATGPFAWRVAPLLPVAERRRYHLFTPDELKAQMNVTPPRALLVGLENDDAELEASLVTWAQARGYVPLPLPDEGTLWVSPLAEWGGAIRLGAHTLPSTMQPGETTAVVFYLQNMRPIASNLNLLVRLVGPAEKEYWRAEGWPWGAATSDWQPGEVWPDGHELAVPPQAPVGCYRVEMNFYAPETLTPLGDPVAVGHLWVGDQPHTKSHCP